MFLAEKVFGSHDLSSSPSPSPFPTPGAQYVGDKSELKSEQVIVAVQKNEKPDVKPQDGTAEFVQTTTTLLSLGRRAATPVLVELTITHSTATYVTPIQLGNDFPTQTLSKTSTSSPKSTAQHPGIPTGSIVGIIIGCIVSFGLLLGVFYIYLLRGRQSRRISSKTISSSPGSSRSRSRRRSRRGSGPAPPPPPPGGDGGPPPAGPFEPANP